MTKRHFFLYDVVLPLAAMLAVGKILSDHFDTFMFRRLDTIHAFGIGAWFAHSPLRETLWTYSWLFFAAAPAFAWLVWVRINMEYDWINQRRKLDRPIFGFFSGMAAWFEGGGESRQIQLAYERRLAQSQDHIHRLEAELAAYESESGEPWQDEYLPPAQQG
jgi:hypothetical protein